MNNSLTNELLQVQLSRSGAKYADLVNEYMTEIPSRVGRSVKKPLSRFGRNMSILNRYRGVMLYNLERKFSSSLRKLRRLRK